MEYIYIKEDQIAFDIDKSLAIFPINQKA